MHAVPTVHCVEKYWPWPITVPVLSTGYSSAEYWVRPFDVPLSVRTAGCDVLPWIADPASANAAGEYGPGDGALSPTFTAYE